MFDIHQSMYRRDEWDEKVAGRYSQQLIEQFAESSEGKGVVERQGSVGGWVDLMFEYAFRYIGVALPEMTTRDMSEVLFELFPRKVSTEPESAPEIVDELRAFWQFLQRQYQLPAADSIVAMLDSGTERRLHAELANPANYGMAKSMFMQGKQAGFDMTTQEGMNAFMQVYNAAQLGRLGALPELPEEELDDFGLPDPGFQSPRLSHEAKAKKKKERKAQRQARKRNRKR